MNLKLTLEKALSTYKNGDADTKKLLINLYGSEHFITDIKDKVTSYESACAILGRKVLSVDDFKQLFGKQAEKQFAGHKIQIGIEAINEGWVPDFDNENQYKYYNWFYNKKRGFDCSVRYYYGVSDLGSSFYIENREKAEVIAKVFKEDYILYLF